MKMVPTELPEVVVIEPTIFTDRRGFFLETFHRDKFAAAGLPVDFVQDNHSASVAGTLRGLHFQDPLPQGKLVRVTVGKIWDVAVDIRTGSPRFGRWIAVELSAANRRQLWIPPGFAHGFCVLSGQGAEMTYKCTEIYHPPGDRGVAWNDPEIGVRWPIDDPILSDKDQGLPRLGEAERLPCWPGSS